MDKNTLVNDIINDPLFDGYGQFIFPTGFNYPSSTMKISNINSLLPYHSHINTDTTIAVLEYFYQKAKNQEKIFYQIYTDEQIKQDPSKKETGLFFFKGRKNGPTAIINAGGGFVYVGSIHESFPHALTLSKQGYNAFALQYRTYSAQTACQDLAAAIVFIFEHQSELEVSMDCYSLWGGSAGARMAAYLGSYGTNAFKQPDYPRAGTIIMQYTGHNDYTPNDPPTYVCVGKKDGIAYWKTMEKRIEHLKASGIETEFHCYPNLGHGFGLGINTTAEGWINDAIAFWQKQIDQKDRK